MSTTEVAPVRNAPDPFEKLIGTIVQRGAAAMASHIKPEAMIRVVLSEARRNTKLRECDPTSLGLCVGLCGQLGLEPTGPLGLAYLIPRKNSKNGGRIECTVIIGYKGYAELVRRSGQVAWMDARVVYAGDEFEVRYGLHRDLIHRPTTPSADRLPENIIGAYCVIALKDGSVYFEYLTIDEIEDRRKRGASGNGSKTPWDTDYAAMCRKSAIRALCTGGLVPLSVELATAIDHERAQEEDIDGDALANAVKSQRSAAGALGLSTRTDDVLDPAERAQPVTSGQDSDDDQDGAP